MPFINTSRPFFKKKKKIESSFTKKKKIPQNHKQKASVILYPVIAAAGWRGKRKGRNVATPSSSILTTVASLAYSQLTIFIKQWPLYSRNSKGKIFIFFFVFVYCMQKIRIEEKELDV